MQTANLSTSLVDGEIRKPSYEKEYGKNQFDSKCGITSVMHSGNSTSNCNLMTMPSISGSSTKQEAGLCDVNKTRKSSFVQKNLELHLSDSQRSKIETILNSVKELSDTEKLLLYLKLPTREDDVPSTAPSNTKQEQTFAFQWIRNNLEECNNSVNLPKHEVYDEYKSYCEGESLTRYLSAPDFGKIVKCIFPNVKARRLGTRGNSKYCYNGLQRKVKIGESEGVSNKDCVKLSEKIFDSKCIKVESGSLTDSENTCEQTYAAASVLVCEWANKLLGRMFETLIGLAKFLVSGSYVSTKSMASFIVMSATEETVKKMNSKYSFDALVSPPTVPAIKVIKTEAVSPLTPIKCTERDRASIQSNEVNSTSDLKKKPSIGAQVVPDMPTAANSDIPSGSTSQCEKLKVDKFTIDVSSPVFLGNSTPNCLSDNLKEENILMDNVNVVIMEKKQNTTLNLNCSSSKLSQDNTGSIPHPNLATCKVQTTSGVVKKRKKKLEKVLLTSSHLKSYKHSTHSHISSNNMDGFDPHASFNSYSPLPPPPAVSAMQVQHNQFFSWQSSSGDIASPAQLPEVEIQNMFANPENQLDFASNLQRCHSVPVVSKPKCVDTDKPLTPQFNANNNPVKHPFKAKRNLFNMFNNNDLCNPNASAKDYFLNNGSSLQNVPNIMPSLNSRTNIERVVPTEPLKDIRPFNNVDMSMQDDDFSGIASNLDHVDGHELLKNFQSSGNWINDWSNMTMPVMNFS